MPTISWSEIDTSKTSKGYLDSLEVIAAQRKGASNAFFGMIQADYEGTLDVDKIINKYDKGAQGRMPYFISDAQCNRIAELYRQFVILQCKYDNLKSEFREKFGIGSDILNEISKIGFIIKPNPEYRNYQSRLEDLKLQMARKEKELANYIDAAKYKKVPPTETVSAVISIESKCFARNF